MSDRQVLWDSVEATGVACLGFDRFGSAIIVPGVVSPHVLHASLGFQLLLQNVIEMSVQYQLKHGRRFVVKVFPNTRYSLLDSESWHACYVHSSWRVQLEVLVQPCDLTWTEGRLAAWQRPVCRVQCAVKMY